jgi:hypothetical protein
MPSAVGTLFSSVDLGARVDAYLKRQAQGTLRPEDKLQLAGSVVSLVSGLSSFIPVAGPFISLTLMMAGIGISGVADGLAESEFADARNKMRDAVVEQFNKDHPGSENSVYPSDVGYYSPM